MTKPVPLADPVRNVVRRLEAERMQPAPQLTPEQQLEADLTELIAALYRAFTTPPDKDRQQP